MKNRNTLSRSRYPGVRARGDTSIQIDFYLKGIRCRETLRIPPTATNLKEANNLRCAVLRDIALRRFDYYSYFPNSKNAVRLGHSYSGNILVADLLDTWYSSYSTDLGSNARRDYELSMRKYLIPIFGNMRVENLTKNLVREKIGALPLAAKTKNNILIPIRKAVEEAYSTDKISKNILAGLRNFRFSAQEPCPFLPEEIDLLIDSFQNPYDQAFYRFAIFAGLRTGEQVALKWEDIDWEDHSILISRALVRHDIGPPKNSLARGRVELLAPAYHSLVEQRARIPLNNPWVFPNQRTQAHFRNYDYLTETWRRALRKCDLSYRKPYQTRHTYASLLLSAGLPIGWLRVQMRHSSYRMLEKHYARWLNTKKDVVKWLREKTHDGHNGHQFNQFFLNKQ